MAHYEEVKWEKHPLCRDTSSKSKKKTTEEEPIHQVTDWLDDKPVKQIAPKPQAQQVSKKRKSTENGEYDLGPQKSRILTKLGVRLDLNEAQPADVKMNQLKEQMNQVQT